METLWNYFELHSNQRMQMMNFYLVMESLFVTGLITMLTSERDMTFYEIGICLAIIFFSFLFYKFDMRTRSIIKICESSIKSLEQKYKAQYGDEIMVFSKEEECTKASHESTYSCLMRLQFIFFVVVALTCLGVVILAA